MKTKKILPAKINKVDIPQLYKRIAPIYDLSGKLIEAKARRRCLEMANIQDGESVLEVAVGTGLLFAEILKMNPSGRNEGIDLTEEMLAHARRRIDRPGMNANHSLRLGDAYHLEYPENTFDVLINNYMFDLLPESDFSLILAEFNRVLRPKGRMILVNMAKGPHWYNNVWEIFYRINAALMGGCRGVSLLPYVNSSGFKNTQKEFVAQMTFPSEVVYGIKP
jgi:ubiquinone/menaquinone biosynthesis C-methylase UbiE